MNIFFLAHAGEEHASETESISHTVSENPLIGILMISAIVLIIGALIIWLLGRKASSPTTHKRKESHVNEPSDS